MNLFAIVWLIKNVVFSSDLETEQIKITSVFLYHEIICKKIQNHSLY